MEEPLAAAAQHKNTKKAHRLSRSTIVKSPDHQGERANIIKVSMVEGQTQTIYKGIRIKMHQIFASVSLDSRKVIFNLELKAIKLFTKLKIRQISKVHGNFLPTHDFLGYIQAKAGNKNTEKKGGTGYRRQGIQPGKAVSGSLRVTTEAVRSPGRSSTMDSNEDELQRKGAPQNT